MSHWVNQAFAAACMYTCHRLHSIKHFAVHFLQVAINTSIGDVNQFLDHIVASTNMKCLTPPRALEGNCGYLAANLYAKSVFGEDALVNLSVEQCADGKLAGYIRIRSKTQGIALSLGDKITLKQKGPAA